MNIPLYNWAMSVNLSPFTHLLPCRAHYCLAVLRQMVHHVNDDPKLECFPSARCLAEALMIDIKTVYKALEGLRTVGLIEQTGAFRGQTPVYQINPGEVVEEAIDAVFESGVLTSTTPEKGSSSVPTTPENGSRKDLGQKSKTITKNDALFYRLQPLGDGRVWGDLCAEERNQLRGLAEHSYIDIIESVSKDLGRPVTILRTPDQITAVLRALIEHNMTVEDMSITAEALANKWRKLGGYAAAVQPARALSLDRYSSVTATVMDSFEYRERQAYKRACEELNTALAA